MDYIKAENKLQSIFYLFIPQVVIPQISFPQTTTQIIPTIRNANPEKTITHILEPIYISRALDMGTCINCNNEQGDLFDSAGSHWKRLPQPIQKKNREKSGRNAGEWTGRIETRKEDIPGSRHSMHGYILAYYRL